MDRGILDPEDWELQRKVAHQAVDDLLNYLRDISTSPVWTEPKDDLLTLAAHDLPEYGRPLDEVYSDIREKILPYRMGNIHPRFWGWVIGSGTFSGALGDFISSTMNSNNAGGNHAGNHIENQVINWAKQLLKYPEYASGLLTTGGSMANIIALTIARNEKCGYDIRELGVQGKIIIYGSTETHSSVQKAAELLGLGNKNYHQIGVNENFEIDCDELESTIERDLKEGCRPVCIVGNVGTVNTGAIDDIVRLRAIADNYGLWLHVDGAFGAIARISPKYENLATGISLGDSLAFDFHKWLYVNYEIGCVLVKNRSAHIGTFSVTPDYLEHGTRGVHGGIWFSDYGVELSRNFKALKAWVMFQELGASKFRDAVTMNIEQAKYLSSLVKDDPQLELMAPVPMNIVCFRYNGGSGDLDKINREIVLQLHEKGIAVPSYTMINGKYSIRVAITNHRSKNSDFEILVKKVVEIGVHLDKTTQ